MTEHARRRSSCMSKHLSCLVWAVLASHLPLASSSILSVTRINFLMFEAIPRILYQVASHPKTAPFCPFVPCISLKTPDKNRPDHKTREIIFQIFKSVDCIVVVVPVKLNHLTFCRSMDVWPLPKPLCPISPGCLSVILD